MNSGAPSIALSYPSVPVRWKAREHGRLDVVGQAGEDLLVMVLAEAPAAATLVDVQPNACTRCLTAPAAVRTPGGR
jgi:hypothetical protein